MARITAVHGIGQQYLGADVLESEWLPSLRSGLRLVNANLLEADDLCCVFYGDLFRPKGFKAPAQPYEPGDVSPNFEQELLEAWWLEAARTDPRVPGSEVSIKARSPQSVQRALQALTRSKFFADIALRTMIGDLKQVSAYFLNEEVRRDIQERVTKAIGPDTLVLIGHSLGSIIAYEALCAHPEWPVRAFVTLGSPLGIRNLVFERLRPFPLNGRGVWPGKVQQWINVADVGDVVALVKELHGPFGEQVQDRLVNNGATAHDVKPYLTAKETGAAILAGLTL